MGELLQALESPVPIVPWEYQGTAKLYGADFLAKTAARTVLVPDDPPRGCDARLLSTASLGRGSFAVGDAIFSPRQWRENPAFEPACMGLPLREAVGRLLRARFPLVSVERAAAAGRYIKLPDCPDAIEGFLEVARADG